MANIILSFDTSSSACSVALQLSDATIKFKHQHAPMQQTKLLLPMIQNLLTENNLQVNQLDAVAFGCGPGSFTGARIASSVAQGLSFGTKIQIIPVSSLAAIAQAAYQEKGWSDLMVAVDARAGNVYWATYQLDNSGSMVLVGKEMITSLDTFKSHKVQGLVVVGDLKDEIDAEQEPTASAVLSLANHALKQGIQRISPQEALPVYLNSVFCVEKN